MSALQLKNANTTRAVCGCTVRAIADLRLGTQLLEREGLVKESFRSGARKCPDLRSVWQGYVRREIDSAASIERGLVLEGSFKGFKKLLDFTCQECDTREEGPAIRSWLSKVTSTPGTTPNWLLADIKERVRSLLSSRKGRGWWRGARILVPDQKGCAELPRSGGGTLSVPGEMWGVEERYRVSAVRTKGKMRIVSMQPALVKQLLRPVHDDLYSWISSQPWIVRGDVEASHYETILSSLEEGESFISGDYSAATDNLNLDAVMTVVDVICESLPEEMSDVLRKSFKDISVFSKHGSGRVVRGSMMGSFCSFPILCILNRVLIDIARGEKTTKKPRRAVAVNGDDCLFGGNREVYDRWEFFTGLVGLVVNREKSGFSKKILELNSQPARVEKGKVILSRKLNMGFLRVQPFEESSPVEALLRTSRQCSWANQCWLLTHPHVRRILESSRTPVHLLTRREWKMLVRKGWFRRSCCLRGDDAVSDAPRRSIPTIRAEALDTSSEEAEALLRMLSDIYTLDWVRKERGAAPGPPPLRRVFRELGEFPIRVERSRVRVRRTWIAPVYSWLTWWLCCSTKSPTWRPPSWAVELMDRHWPREVDFLHRSPLWVPEQPSLCFDREAVITRGRDFPPCLPSDLVPVVSDGARYYVLQ